MQRGELSTTTEGLVSYVEPKARVFQMLDHHCNSCYTIPKSYRHTLHAEYYYVLRFAKKACGMFLCY